MNIFAASSYSVKIYNAQGEQKIHLPSVSGLEHTVPVQHLPQGMYYIKVFHPEIGTLEKTIVKE
ncbi:MAG: T9SS type A sorting domain-containing protein [Raineya sp.]